MSSKCAKLRPKINDEQSQFTFLGVGMFSSGSSDDRRGQTAIAVWIRSLKTLLKTWLFSKY